MTKTILTYGSKATLELDLADDALIAWADMPEGTPIDDVTESVVEAFAHPLDFPSLDQAMVPGDMIAIVLDRALPEPVELVTGAVRSLLAYGAKASDITVLFPSYEDRADGRQLQERLEEVLDDGVRFVTHDPNDSTELCYVGASAEQRAIYIQRAILDADLLIPIGCLRASQSRDYFGIHGNLFPTFSDAQTIRRFLDTAESESQRGALRNEVEEVGQLLGVLFTIQVVPGGHGQVLRVLTGDARAVAEQGSQLFSRAWDFSPRGQANLVVASLTGGPSEQTWGNVARALAGASQVLEDDGAIVLCTELTEPPGPEMLAWADDADRDAYADPTKYDVDDRPEKTDAPLPMGSPDSQAAASEVARARSRGTVFLLSGLGDDVVEELGIAPVADTSEIGRLVAQHNSCILIGHAQHRAPNLSGETAERSGT